MKNQLSLRISELGMEFLDRLRTNRRKNDVDNKDLSNWKLLELIYLYFKNNNKEYQDLLKMEYKKNV